MARHDLLPRSGGSTWGLGCLGERSPRPSASSLLLPTLPPHREDPFLVLRKSFSSQGFGYFVSAQNPLSVLEQLLLLEIRNV